MNNFETVIGIEIHIELNTKTKMFSPIANDFGATPNTLVGPIDIAYPGTLPSVNKGSVVRAIKLAKALEMDIDDEIHFDRKHYFYQDIPKSYQITQQFRPIAKNGKLPIFVNGKKKFIEIERFHLEEDTAKTLNVNGKVLLNYNRAGVPLIEIVTEPVIRSAKEAAAYIDTIRKVAKALDISDAKMEEGSLRADINISLRPYGQEEFGTKTEVKNVNSISNVEKAIELEVALQTKKLLSGVEVEQETKRFDDSVNKVVVMRAKGDAADYRYFEDPNIPVIKLEKDFIDSINPGELPWETEKRLADSGIKAEFIEQLTSDKAKLSFIDSSTYENKTKLTNVFFSEVVSLANSKNLSVTELNIKISDFDKMLNYLDQGIISGSHVKKITPLLSSTNDDVDQIIEANNLKQISDEKQLSEIIDRIMIDNEKFINDNKERMERVSKFVLGQLMKQSKGQANPVVANKLVTKKLEG